MYKYVYGGSLKRIVWFGLGYVLRLLKCIICCPPKGGNHSTFRSSMRVYSLAHHFLYHIDLAKNTSLLFFLVTSEVGCLFMFIGLVYFLCCQCLCFIFCFLLLTLYYFIGFILSSLSILSSSFLIALFL